MPVRKRRRLVPKVGVECFEVRVVLYFTDDGVATVAYEITTEDGPTAPPLHEVLGALSMAGIMVADQYGADA